jgi:hypothetical protein
VEALKAELVTPPRGARVFNHPEPAAGPLPPAVAYR